MFDGFFFCDNSIPVYVKCFCVCKLVRVILSIAPMRMSILLIDLLWAIEGLKVINHTEHAERVISLC